MTRTVDTIPAAASTPRKRQTAALFVHAAIAVALISSGCATGTGSGGGFAVQPATYDTSGAKDTGASDAGANVDTGASSGGPTDTGAPKDTGSVQDAGPTKDTGTAKDTGPAKDTGGAGSSCVGKCGAKYNPKLACQCNDLCGKYGNCCADYFKTCQPETLSCKNRCTVGFDKALPCQCGWDCPKYGSCCKDWLSTCSGNPGDYLYAAPGECDSASDWVKTKAIKDGDTLLLQSGETVRFLIVNTPEIKEKQCYAYEARSFTSKRLKEAGYKVCLIKDPNQPDKDKYNRLLRYVYIQKPGQLKAIQLNARLVRQGYGPVYYPFAKGNKHEKVTLVMQQLARFEKLGGWGKCGWEKELPKP